MLLNPLYKSPNYSKHILSYSFLFLFACEIWVVLIREDFHILPNNSCDFHTTKTLIKKGDKKSRKKLRLRPYLECLCQGMQKSSCASWPLGTKIGTKSCALEDKSCLIGVCPVLLLHIESLVILRKWKIKRHLHLHCQFFSISSHLTFNNAMRQHGHNLFLSPPFYHPDCPCQSTSALGNLSFWSSNLNLTLLWMKLPYLPWLLYP